MWYLSAKICVIKIIVQVVTSSISGEISDTDRKIDMFVPYKVDALSILIVKLNMIDSTTICINLLFEIQ